MKDRLTGDRTRDPARQFVMGLIFGVVIGVLAAWAFFPAQRANADESPLRPRLAHFTMGFTVTTHHNTNVVVRWKTKCHSGQATFFDQGQFKTITPIARNVQPPVANADSCHLHVVAWDVPPWHNPHQGDNPVVTSWVTQ